MDLAGPKLRTGPLEPGPAVVRIHPQRDVNGRVTSPARIWLTSDTSPQPPPSQAALYLPVPVKWFAHLHKGNCLKFIGVRGARRSFTVIDVTPFGCWTEATQTAYIVPGTILRQARKKGKREDRETSIGDLPPGAPPISLRQGDLLILTRDLKPGRPAAYDSAGQILTPAMIGRTIPEVFEDVRVGESIWFDDGKIGGVVEKMDNVRVLVRITQETLKPVKLRADKGINLLDGNLCLAAMSAKDIEDLTFVAQQADVVELSFANTVQDVETL